MDTSSSNLVSSNEIPIIDLANKGSSKKWIEETAKQLKHSITKFGVVLLINHGISKERMAAVYNVMGTFCALPVDVKNLYKLSPPDYLQGYIPHAKEKFVGEENEEIKHCYDINNLSAKLPREEIPNFMEVIGGVVEEFLNLSRILLNVIAVAFDIEPELLLSHHNKMFTKENLTTVRMHYYPPVEEEVKPNVIRCGEHYDWGTFTLLTEDRKGGLEIFKEGEWIPVDLLPGSFLFNFGLIMEILSSSQCKAVNHRVVVPKDINAHTKARHSFAFLVRPDNSTLIHPSTLKPCQSLRSEDNKPEDHIPTAFQYIMAKRFEAFKY